MRETAYLMKLNNQNETHFKNLSTHEINDYSGPQVIYTLIKWLITSH